MDNPHYLNEFASAAARLDPALLTQKNMEAEPGIWLDSVVLKLYKKPWINERPGKPRFSSAIFFSVWVNDASLKANKLLYNIHALKLREFKNYSLTSREFATVFRKGFKKFEDQWPNISTDFGPLTLMEGWKKLNAETLEKDILELAHQFLKIDHLIDNLLVFK